MNGNDLKSTSHTDWDRVKLMTDEKVDTGDIPPLDDDFYAHAELRLPERKPEQVTVDNDMNDKRPNNVT